MSRKKSKTPSYLLHQSTGQARVRLRVDGRVRDIYLGPFGSPESWEKYHRLVAEYLQNCGKSGSASNTSQSEVKYLSIAELVLKYDDFSRQYYVKDGEIM